MTFDLRKYLPKTDHGAILVTTRSSMVKLGQTIHLRKLEDINESLEILASVSGQEDLRQDPKATDLARELDGLPLALATAGAYLEQVSIGYAEYLQLYRDSWQKLHEETPQLQTYDQTLYSTWNLSYRYIQQQSPLAAMLLRQWAYFANEDLWCLEMLRDQEIDNAAVSALDSLGLFYWDQGRLQEADVMCERALEGCDKAWGQEHTSTLETVNNLGLVYWSQGRILEAEAMYKRALEDREKAWGQGHTLALKIINNLGVLYTEQGRLQEAGTMCQRALEGCEKAWGRQHTSTLDIANNLGFIYADQDRLQEAEAMYKRALEGHGKAFDATLPVTYRPALKTLKNYGFLCEITGDVDTAILCYQRTLVGTEAVWGRHDKWYAWISNRLSSLQHEKCEASEEELVPKNNKRRGAYGNSESEALRCVQT
ncbi:hypothetical protein PDE_04104 [Penicillium oxalicum 114-2]|uniref:Uncharacterized protein n=1 Tax=Penicillium oxalicum (strain 114-2 / CGMCC 5302) TaxID=933388 RepID=S7ZEQ8_PENO1|nr:hypothetical protein PDE_04104 [Penicillium oxalicum 114-2]